MPAAASVPYSPQHGRDGACIAKVRKIDTIINTLLDDFYRTKYMT